MANNILTTLEIAQSPFDSIQRFRSDGAEYWSARELMPLLGYRKWERFNDAIDRAKISCAAAGSDEQSHFPEGGKLVKLPQGGTVERKDFELSRLAAYLTAMNGDPRKPEVAAAQSYFAIKTREAETIIPIQNDRLRELELEFKLMELKNSMVTIHGKDLTLRLMGDKEALIETKITVTEVIDPVSGYCREILTADQLKQVVKSRTGQKLPSLKWFADKLRAAGRDDLLVPVTRSATNEYPIPDSIDEALDVVYGKERQRLVGE